MAKMYPELGPQNTGSDRAEPDIYWRLAKQLDDDFTIVHSLPWLATAAKEIDGRDVPTGELDFLILHPQLGILAIEVKGGILSHHRTQFTYKRTGQTIDPIRQVRRGTHALAEWIAKSGGGYRKIGYCLLFPDSEMSGNTVPPALFDATSTPPQNIALDIKHLPELGKHIQVVMAYWKKSLGVSGISQKDINILVELLLPLADYTPSWQTRIANDTVTWLKLTNEQTECLDEISSRDRVVVTGWPGTGKTLLGIEHARRLNKRNRNVLFVTYNYLLTKKLRRELRDTPGIRIATFYELCRQAAGIVAGPSDMADAPIETVPPEWYATDGPNALFTAISQARMPIYDALIVDEGQALRTSWWNSLTTWFSREAITVFCDETQVFPFEESSSVQQIASSIGAGAPYTLTINLRSPRVVYDRIRKVKVSGYQQMCPRPLEADALSEYIVADPEAKIGEVIQELKGQGVPQESIYIIATKYEPPDAVKQTGINWTSAAKYRGLEAPVIIVWAYGGADDATLLCAYTRATSRCIVIYDAVHLTENGYATFGKLLLESEKKDDIQREASVTLTTTTFDQANLNLITAVQKTGNVVWCNEWSAWIVRPDEFDEVSLEMWRNHLIVSGTLPVLYWGTQDRGVLHAITRPLGINDYLPASQYLLAPCEVCGVITPWSPQGNGYVCAACASPANYQVPKNALRQLAESDGILYTPASASLSDKHNLSVFLLALGRWRKLSIKQQQAIQPVITGDRLSYQAAQVLTAVDIVNLQKGKYLELDECTERYWGWSLSLQSQIDFRAWRDTVASAISTWYRRKMLYKVDTGKYAGQSH